MIRKLPLAFAAAALLASGTSAAPPSSQAGIGQEARIPFAATSGIRNFQADGTRGIYIEDVHGKWYHGSFIGSCLDLPYANAIGVDTRGTSDLDKFGSIRVRRQSCALNSLVRVEGPPKKVKKKPQRRI